MPSPGGVAIEAPGDLGQAPWAQWPKLVLGWPWAPMSFTELTELG